MLRIRFLIYCPIGVKTGGPECLYQLCDALNSLGLESYLIPSIETISLKPCSDFAKYNVKYLHGKDIRDSDILVLPEVSNRVPRWLANRIHSSRTVIWWLSVDNCPLYLFNNFEQNHYDVNKLWIKNLSSTANVDKANFSQKIMDRILNLKTLIHSWKIRFLTLEINYKSCFHYAQSEYARKIVSEKLSKEVRLLTDYVYDAENKTPKISKKVSTIRQIAYNPLKGSEFIDKFVSICQDEFKFIKVNNMNSQEVSETLQNSDLYLDLGHFPGKDRIPREAILESCPVILAMRGAARNNIDFKLSSEFKINLSLISPYELKKKILYLFDKKQLFEEQIDFFVQQTKAKKEFLMEVREFSRFFEQLNKKESIGRGV